MEEITLIFPHQLFHQCAALKKEVPVYLVEEPLFFRQYRFHRQKLVLHRASMKYYAHWLTSRGYQVNYIECHDPGADCRTLLGTLAAAAIKAIHITEVTDDWLERRLKNSAARNALTLVWHGSPGFLNEPQELDEWFGARKEYRMAAFYTWQRKKHGLLLTASGGPQGGQWSFDNENRRRWPATKPEPRLDLPADNAWLQEARDYILRHFPDNPGSVNPPHFFAAGFEDASHWLRQFTGERLGSFGAYEDAIVAGGHVLSHSLLSPLLNTGLLTPAEVLAATTGADGDYAPQRSREGFVRQVLGWREFVRIVYLREGTKQRNSNFWDHHRRIPPPFWTGDTGILPLDVTIKKILRSGYCHHIERLMVLGNFMLLCEFDPTEVYRWFMELFIDAYDWVMVPNVYGMSQFADGGLITTKPYISGSHYLVKMGNYPPGPWQSIWDGLFWRFIHRHREFFASNQRMAMLVAALDRQDPAKRKTLLATADNWLASLDASPDKRNIGLVARTHFWPKPS